jgi:hypothetical protein
MILEKFKIRQLADDAFAQRLLAVNQAAFCPDTVPEDAPLLEVVNTDINESKTTRLLVRDLSFGTLKG